MLTTWQDAWHAGDHLQISELNGLITCEKDWRWEMEKFDDFDLWIVLDGSGEISIDGDQFPLHAGFAVCFTPGLHRVRARHNPEEPLQVFFCHFSVKGKSPPSFTQSHKCRPTMLKTEGLLRSTAETFTAHRSNKTNAAFREIFLWQLLFQFETQAAQIPGAPVDRIRDQLHAIEAHPARSWSVETLAKEAGLSGGHYRRLFQSLTGASPMKFIIECRIRRACYYLRQTRMTVSEIATITGYQDIASFSRQFKERKRCSPLDYRRTEIPPS